jgi:excisionase family DNA binding protein
MEQKKTWLKVPEVAELLGLPRSRAYELVANGTIPAVRISERTIRVHKAQLENYLLENRRVIAAQDRIAPARGSSPRGEWSKA